MNMRRTTLISAVLLMIASSGFSSHITAQVQARADGQWVMPRTADDRPDLQGNWTNATITPIQRRRDQDAVYSPEEASRLEGGRAARTEALNQPSDPDRVAPPVGGDGSTGAAGGVGGYNYFWIDAGDRVAMFDGEPRTSLIIDPADGRYPSRTDASRQRMAEASQFRRQFGQYDNPENRPLAERCVVSFGSNAGPPMLPNYFYNNNYTIVQTPDHIMIMTEMVHDVRIIQMGTPKPLPKHVKPWFGDSWGHWEGDTLVVETTNFSPTQLNRGQLSGATDNLKITERLTRADEYTLNYEFTVDDPETWTDTWSGEVPFTRLPGLVYEYACHEGNYAMFNVLSGARAQERREGGRQTPER